jgi:hypothetical protein
MTLDEAYARDSFMLNSPQILALSEPVQVKRSIEQCSLDDVRALCERYHGYGGAGGVAVYTWAVIEDGRKVAGFSWQPPAPGAAISVCKEQPASVLALSRMVAVPKTDRILKHISKPLRTQMRTLIDRTRWPVLVTFSDEGQGHNGFVYQCSGWEKTTRKEVPIFEDAQGRRTSRYSNGKTGGRALRHIGTTWVQRWEHWACNRGEAADWMQQHGWRRVPTGRTYRSGAPAFRFEQTARTSH